MSLLKYPLPSYCKGQLTQKEYCYWVSKKAQRVHDRDCRLGRAFALISSRSEYSRVIYEADVAGNGIDPFTGDKLRYDLVDTWDERKAKDDISYERSFDLMPAVDHIDPRASVLKLEICSSRINTCKNEQDPKEFLEMCRRIVNFTPPKLPEGGLLSSLTTSPLDLLTVPAIYFPPDYLKNIFTADRYRKWLSSDAKSLFDRDRKLGRPYALPGHRVIYKQLINEAVKNGMFDPFTGETLQWELVGLLDPTKMIPGSYDMTKFRLLPTVDHVYPRSDVLELEICSHLINNCKGNLNPGEFVEICKRVVTLNPI